MFIYLKCYIKNENLRGVNMNQIKVRTRIRSSRNFLSKTKLEIFKVIILLAAVMYLYYCAIYSLYWYLIK